MKVLIAEDSAVSRAALQSILSSLGHECIVAEDGNAAWELFLSEAPDVVISDWLMPGIDGDELCRRVREHPGASYTYFILLTSLASQAHVVRGMMAGADDYLKKPFDTDDLGARLIAAARVVKLNERRNARRTDLEARNVELFDESRHDPLTDVGNRIALRERLEQLSGAAQEFAGTYCVALYDVDGFKGLNDTQGHLAGDNALRMVAGALAGNARSGDTVFRYGGDEFVIVLPAQTLEAAEFTTERMRDRVTALAIPYTGGGPEAIVTVSAGVAELEDADAGDFDAVLKRADEALYRSKANRNGHVEHSAR
jgi:two-component system cell cycle response regulator